MRPKLFSTRITELFGIRHPILCGGMGPGVSDAVYCAAVAKVGGIAFITAAEYPDAERFRDELVKCRELAGGGVFGANMYLSRRPGGIDKFRPHIKVMAEEGVRFVETSGQSPETILPAFRDAGLKVIHKVPAVRYAKTAERLGVDAVIIVGQECGGHPGRYMIGSMVQAAQAPRELKVPVVIGGGIGTGGQIAAILAMGNEGVVLGTRMLVSEELWIHQNYKEMVAKSDGTNNRVVMQSFNDAHRQLDNETTQAVLELERQGIRELEAYLPHMSGKLRRQAYQTGDYSRGGMGLGQSAVFANRIEPVEKIFDDLIDEAREAVRRVSRIQAVDA